MEPVGLLFGTHQDLLDGGPRIHNVSFLVCIVVRAYRVAGDMHRILDPDASQFGDEEVLLLSTQPASHIGFLRHPLLLSSQREQNVRQHIDLPEFHELEAVGQRAPESGCKGRVHEPAQGYLAAIVDIQRDLVLRIGQVAARAGSRHQKPHGRGVKTHVKTIR